MRCRRRDHDVVPLADVEPAVDALERCRTRLDVDELVADRVAVQRPVAVRRHVADAHVAVAEQELAAAEEVTASLERMRPEVARSQRQVRLECLWLDLDLLGCGDRGRDLTVVEQCGLATEPLDAHELLGVQAPVRTTELGVALVGHLTHAAVVRHRLSPSLTE
jgi:hypothetical protein